MRILIVEDEPAVAAFISSALQSKGHEVVVAGSGEEALSILEQDWPEAVLLDVVMPGLSGIDVLRRIRPTQPGLPVVILTGRADAAQIAEARRLGVTDVIEKPVGLRQISEALLRLGPRRS